jgi:hypothetical protein
MLKNILKLEGTQELTKTEQKNINGGVTEQCSFDVYVNHIAIIKGGKPCPAAYPLSIGGCCYPMD